MCRLSPVACCKDFFPKMEQQFKDPRAGPWPRGVVTAVAAVADNCLAWNAHKRSTVREVLPALLAACKKGGLKL